VPTIQPSQQAVHAPHSRRRAAGATGITTLPQHFLYFLLLPQGQGSLGPSFISYHSFAIFTAGKASVVGVKRRFGC
jgi:hypothetical protein